MTTRMINGYKIYKESHYGFYRIYKQQYHSYSATLQCRVYYSHRMVLLTPRWHPDGFQPEYLLTTAAAFSASSLLEVKCNVPGQ